MPLKVGVAAVGPRTYGWDTSHYDGTLTAARARTAFTAGVCFATHKLGEGGNYVDPLAAVNLAALKGGGIPVLGGYYVVRTPGVSIAGQVAHCIATADKVAPWWRTWPDWFFQVDLERWSGGDQVSAATGLAFAKALRAAQPRPVVLYASHGMYGDQLATWDGVLWNANYGSEPVGPFRDVYPGDASAGWAEYSGKVPAILQYSSKSIIAGLTTCDANAFRGTLDQLRALLKGEDMDLTAQNLADIAHANWYTRNIPSANPTETPATAVLGAQNNSAAALTKLDALIASQAGQDKKLDALTAALAALAAGGGADIAPVLAAVADVKATESAAVAALQAQVVALRKALADADTAAAAKLAG